MNQSSQFVSDFGALVVGTGDLGCGLEAQLESWYRFLVQPDPYDWIGFTSDSPPQAALVSVDATLLKMRHDFLRPDSLVVIIQLTDEEDSWSDPQWIGGYGWTSRTSNTNAVGGPGNRRRASRNERVRCANQHDDVTSNRRIRTIPTARRANFRRARSRAPTNSSATIPIASRALESVRAQPKVGTRQRHQVFRKPRQMD